MKTFLAMAAVALVIGAGLARAVEIGADIQYLSTDQQYDKDGIKTAVPQKVTEMRIPVTVMFGLAGPLKARVMAPYVSRTQEAIGTAPAITAAGLGDVEGGIHLAPNFLRIGVDGIVPTGTSFTKSTLGKTDYWTGGTMLGDGGGFAYAGGWYGVRPSIRVEPPLPGFDLWAEGGYLLTLETSSATPAGTAKINYGDPLRIAGGGGMAFGPLTVGLGLEYVATGKTTVALDGPVPVPVTDVPNSESQVIRLLPEVKVKAGPFGARFGAAISLAGKTEVAGATLSGGLLLKF